MLNVRRVTASVALLLIVACTTAPSITPNKYGLRVVPDLATYERIARIDPGQRLLDLGAFLPAVVIDVRYATTNNFMKQVLYPVGKAWLRRPAAVALREVQNELKAWGLGLKIFDGYRPYRITEKMWEPIRNPDFVADPARGSRHNRGAAVDLTLVELATGRELEMPTPYDDFTPRARHDFNDLPPEAIANRARLRDVMSRHGFDPLPSEWWHYDFKGWQQFDLMNVPLEELGS